ncbi:hypothetical protein QYF36_020714 [Acer negundo]|nr:hypothetical protein QYF36_020714 [Acer negundo]
MKYPEYVELMQRLCALGDGNQDHSTLSPNDWEVAHLYLAVVLRKDHTSLSANISSYCLQRGQPDQTQSYDARRDKGHMYISKEDIMYINGKK